MSTVLATIVSFFLTVHRALYVPEFEPLPVVVAQKHGLPETLTLPAKKQDAVALPRTGAESYLVVDQTSGEVLAEHNADKKLFPASTTKIMTALLVLETMDTEKVASLSGYVSRDGSVMELFPGEQIRIKDLLAGLLIHSSNDAATVLASQYPGGERAFVARMNSRAKELHMDHTVFRNPSGLIDPGHVTSVRDLVILTRVAMQQPLFAQLVKTKELTVYSADGVYSHKLESTNELLGKVMGLEGVKTGWTEEAGECLVTQTTRDGHTVITAVLHSPNRFEESRQLIEWVYASYEWQTNPVAIWAEKT